MSKIIVFGSNGYIGQHIVNRLGKTVGIDDLFLFDIHKESVIPTINYRRLNLKEPLSTEHKAILDGADAVFYFSGLTGTMKSIENYQDFIEINEVGLLNVLNCIKDFDKKPKIIFPSTRLVYKGINDKLLLEDDEKEHKTIYSVNKYACERYLEIYKNLYQINYTIFRICVPYGNLLNSELSFGTLSHFIGKAKSGQNIVLYGDGKLKRSFTHVGDLTELLVSGGLNKLTDNQIFNISSNDHLSLFQVAKAIADLYQVEIEFTAFPKQDIAIESGDTMFDGGKLCKLLGYNYKYLFSDWIKNL